MKNLRMSRPGRVFRCHFTLSCKIAEAATKTVRSVGQPRTDGTGKPLPHALVATGRNESDSARNVRETIEYRVDQTSGHGIKRVFLADADGVRLVDLPGFARGDGSAIDDDQVKGTLVIGSRPFDFIDDAPCRGNIGAAAAF